MDSFAQTSASRANFAMTTAEILEELGTAAENKDETQKKEEANHELKRITIPSPKLHAKSLTS
jgi:hypothetical protein